MNEPTNVLDLCSGCGALAGEWHYPACYNQGKARQGDRYEGKYAVRPAAQVVQACIYPECGHRDHLCKGLVLHAPFIPDDRRRARQFLSAKMTEVGDQLWAEIRKLKGWED